MISPGRIWWLIQRDLRRGWSASYHDHVTLPRIGRFTLPSGLGKAPEVPVHVLTGKQDWQLAAWMLASWFHFTGLNWKVVLHEDGTLPGEAANLFQRVFPGITLINSANANQTIQHALSQYPLCLKYRFEHPLARKIFDVPFFSDSKRLILLDSDLLFFTRPNEILHWVGQENQECWFNEDASESSFVSKEEAKEKLGVNLWPRVNSGLCLLWKEAIDWEFCERCLKETSILKGRIWRVEQTLFALCASRQNQGGLLPSTYEVSLSNLARDGAVARHYVGAVRDRFFGEGLPKVAPQILRNEPCRAKL